MINTWKRHLHSAGYSENTVCLRIRSVREFLDICGRDISPRGIKKWQHRLIERDLSVSTRIVKTVSVRAYLGWLRENDQILFDPLRAVPVPGKEKRVPRVVLGEEEIKNILNLFTTRKQLRRKAIVELFYSTGIRRSELLNLDLYDLQLKERVLFIRQGKGGTDRLLPLVKKTVDVLSEYLHKSRCKAEEKTQALFLAPDGTRMKSKAVDVLCQWIREALEMEKPVSPHVFRHSIATHLLQRGLGIRYIQSFLGHADLSSTEIYTRVVPRETKKMIDHHHPRNRMK